MLVSDFWTSEASKKPYNLILSSFPISNCSETADLSSSIKVATNIQTLVVENFLKHKFCDLCILVLMHGFPKTVFFLSFFKVEISSYYRFDFFHKGLHEFLGEASLELPLIFLTCIRKLIVLKPKIFFY